MPFITLCVWINSQSADSLTAPKERALREGRERERVFILKSALRETIGQFVSVFVLACSLRINVDIYYQ